MGTSAVASSGGCSGAAAGTSGGRSGGIGRNPTLVAVARRAPASTGTGRPREERLSATVWGRSGGRAGRRRSRRLGRGGDRGRRRPRRGTVGGRKGRRRARRSAVATSRSRGGRWPRGGLGRRPRSSVGRPGRRPRGMVRGGWRRRGISRTVRGAHVAGRAEAGAGPGTGIGGFVLVIGRVRSAADTRVRHQWGHGDGRRHGRHGRHGLHGRRGRGPSAAGPLDPCRGHRRGQRRGGGLGLGGRHGRRRHR